MAVHVCNSSAWVRVRETHPRGLLDSHSNILLTCSFLLWAEGHSWMNNYLTFLGIPTFRPIIQLYLRNNFGQKGTGNYPYILQFSADSLFRNGDIKEIQTPFRGPSGVLYWRPPSPI